MKHKDIMVLKRILEYCTQVDETCAEYGNDYAVFQNKHTFQNACCMCILQIGELCKVISEELRAEENAIPWRQWCGVRDIFAHQYSNLDVASAWDTIQIDLPKLREQVKRILNTKD